MVKESKLIKKVSGLKPIKWVADTSNQVFSRKNLNEYGVPVMVGFTLFAGLETLGYIDGMFDALGVSGASKMNAYAVIGPGSKIGCVAAMNYEKFANTDYKQIAKDTAKDFAQLLKNTSNNLKNSFYEFADAQINNPNLLKSCK
ncbi:MAG: hypothetical protein WC812_02615 [Candidatus Pacearchaeota archaeon]|jgi:hypothetical protein